MMNTATLLSRTNMELTRQTPEDMSTAVLNRWHELLVQVLSKLEPFATIEKGILADRSLSNEGQQKRLAKAALDSLPEWEAEGRVLRALEAELAAQRLALFTIKPTIKDDLLRYLRAREIRDRMAALSHAERDVAYLTASQQDQPEVLLALLDAPGGSWVSPDVQQRADIERGKHAQPDLFGAYTQNELLRERLLGLCDHLAQWMRALGVPPAKVATTLGLSA